MKLRIKKLNEAGFDHIAIITLFFVVFAIIGTYYLFTSLAASAPTYVQLRIGSYSGDCIAGNVLAGCSTSSSSQVWQTLQGSNFQIKNKAGQCLEDLKGASGTYYGSSASNRVYVSSGACQTGNVNQDWNWTGSGIHRLASVVSKSAGCINSLGAYETANTQLIVYTCNSQNSEEYFEKSVPSSSGGTSSSGGSGSSTLVKTNGTPAALVFEDIKNSQGYYMCLDNYQDGNAEVDAYQCNDQPSQKWVGYQGEKFGSNEDIYLKINNMCVGTKNSASAANTPIVIQTCNGGHDQVWEINTANVEALFNPYFGKCITDLNASATNGTFLELEPCPSITSSNFLFPATPASSALKS